MNKVMKVLNIKGIWNKNSQIKDGDVLEVEWCQGGNRYVFLDPSGNAIEDEYGTIIWFDQDDIDSEAVEEYFAPIPKTKVNVITVERPESSNVKSVTYFVEEQVLIVAFVQGGLYRYSNVTENCFNNCVKSESMGKFVANTLKFNYPCLKIA